MNENHSQSSDPIRLAIIRQRYNPFGGAERFVERALGALVREGIEVTLITRDWAGAPRDDFRQITCNPKYSRIFGGRSARDKSFAASVTREISQGRYNIIQSHERILGCTIFRAGDGVHAAWLDHRARNSSFLKRTISGLSPFHRNILKQEKAMLAHPALKAVICISPLVKDEMQRYYDVPENKLVVIENGIDLNDFSPRLMQERERQRQLLGLDMETPVFLFVGSGFERKGVRQLLFALAQMKSTESKLVVVGYDSHISLFERLAQKLGVDHRVIFTGPQQDARPFYGMADAFTLPTLYDPMSNAALEAMACGLPSILSHTCGFSSRITQGENGFVCDALDVDKLAEHMDYLSLQKNALAMRHKSRAAVEDLGIETMANRLIALYRSLL